MSIQIENNIITLHTKHTSYQMMIHEQGFLLHTYYGNRTNQDMSYLIRSYDRGFSGNPYELAEDRSFSLDALPQEYPCFGTGDFRPSSLVVKDQDGVFGCDLRYDSHEVLNEKYQLAGLPAVYQDQLKAQTLKIILKDCRLQLKVTLLYGIIDELDVITRAVKIENQGQRIITLTKCLSTNLDFLTGDFDLIHFHGRHAMERLYERTAVMNGTNSIGSIRGTSSHQHNPFVILADKETNEDIGACYGASFLFSGNFICETQKDQYGQLRMNMGVSDQLFAYELEENECFIGPEVAHIYSAKGLTDLSQKYHHLIREQVCRGPHRDRKRPVLINNWEATYFDFDGEKIVDIARTAKELGVEMLVLDDGWFGKRDSDNSGLGDWIVNEEKMKGSLADVVKKIKGFGMKFGLWIEPEMVNEDSQLYRMHPDYVLQIPGKKPVKSRNQLVLDFSRPEVVSYIFDLIEKVIDETNVDYIKMDMNRSISDVYTQTAQEQNHGKIMYKYVLGVYEFLEKLLYRYPNLLIEGCSGGGGRFDAGMLYYTPQIWCSDNTDGIDRLAIQYGTSFGYPISAVGSHVSAVPNHQTGRSIPIQTRGIVAMAGTFGYELNLDLLSSAEKEEVREQIKLYHKFWPLIFKGSYYRLHHPMTDKELMGWMFVSKDKNEGLLNLVSLNAHGNAPVYYVRCKGLEAHKLYILTFYGVNEPTISITGQALMDCGISITRDLGEYQAMQVHLQAKDEA